MPNSSLAGGNIINYSATGTRRIDLVACIGYGDDLAAAKNVLTEMIAAEKRVLPEPEPTIAVLELADSSVNLAVRPWVKSEDYWDVYFALTEQMKLRLDKAGISIPFPQQDVYMHNVAE